MLHISAFWRLIFARSIFHTTLSSWTRRPPQSPL